MTTPTPSPDLIERLFRHAFSLEAGTEYLKLAADLRQAAATLETRAAEIAGLREALGRIARNEVEVFDTDLARHVIVSMDAEELAEIASEALLTTAPPAPGMGEG